MARSGPGRICEESLCEVGVALQFARTRDPPSLHFFTLQLLMFPFCERQRRLKTRHGRVRFSLGLEFDQTDKIDWAKSVAPPASMLDRHMLMISVGLARY